MLIIFNYFRGLVEKIPGNEGVLRGYGLINGDSEHWDGCHAVCMQPPCVCGLNITGTNKLLSKAFALAGYCVDVKGYCTDVKGYCVDVKGYCADVKGYYC
eukprot:1177002-Prorocentrum_minimum.AAC.6